jgi:hypothetical protein
VSRESSVLKELFGLNSRDRSFVHRLLDRVVQFRISSDDLQVLEELKQRTKARTISEVIRNALWLYHMLLSALEQGKRIVIEDNPASAAMEQDDAHTAVHSVLSRR